MAMKKFWVISCVSILAISSFIGILQVKSEETALTAHFLMLACEGCNHMMVDASDSADDVGKTIIPVSDVVDIDKLIDEIALTKESVCLVGKFYKFNPNLFPVNPAGYKFEVLEIRNKGKCI